MLWWVSATGLCALLLGGVWLKREELGTSTSAVRNGIAILIGGFLLSVVLYGGHIVLATRTMTAEVQGLCPPSDVLCKMTFATEFRTVGIGVAIGTSSFVLALMAWVAVWWIFLRPGKTPSGLSEEIPSQTPNGGKGRPN